MLSGTEILENLFNDFKEVKAVAYINKHSFKMCYFNHDKKIGCFICANCELELHFAKFLPSGYEFFKKELDVFEVEKLSCEEIQIKDILE